MSTADHPSEPDTAARDFVVGSGSRVWRVIQASLGEHSHRFIGLRHSDCAGFTAPPGSRIWIFAYSRRESDNLQLFASLRAGAPQCEFIYLTSSSCIVTKISQCYEYPRVKQHCAQAARQLLDARILTLGLMHERLDDLPRGTNAATSIERLRQFMLAPAWPADRAAELRLFTSVARPFANGAEAALYRLYGLMLRACGSWPCLLRPLDALLRAMGIRWYGYTYLSNRLWTAKN